MFLCDNHWKFWTISILQIWNKLSENKNYFEKLEYRFLIERPKIENTTFLYKTALSEIIVKTNSMGSTKWNYHKEQSIASDYFIFFRILFQFKNLL